MRIGVLGASGYVGNSTYRHLKQSGHDVTAIARRAGSFEAAPVLLDEFLKGAGPRLDVLVNCIGLAHGKYTAEDYRRVEVDLLSDIMSAVDKQHIPKFVHISSAAAQYAKNLYGQFKQQGESIVAGHGDRLDFIILRPTMIYGKGAPGHPATLRRVLSRNLPVPFGAIGTRKSALYIKNMTYVTGKIIEENLFNKQTYSVSDTGSIPFNRFIEMNRNAVGSRSWLIRVPPSLISLACVLGNAVDGTIMRFPLNSGLLDVLMTDTSKLDNDINERIELPYQTEDALYDFT